MTDKDPRKRKIPCWLIWEITEDGRRLVKLTYRRSVIHELEVPAKTGAVSIAAQWWNTQATAMEWARRKGFIFVKEKLHGRP